jgi:hypothetical protein
VTRVAWSAGKYHGAYVLLYMPKLQHEKHANVFVYRTVFQEHLHNILLKQLEKAEKV